MYNDSRDYIVSILINDEIHLLNQLILIRDLPK